MTGSDRLEALRELYEASLAEHGPGPRGVGWRDAAGQNRRFGQLARVLDEDPGPFTVADLGCGYGALFGFLAARVGHRLAGYHGYDISPAMLDTARGAVRDPRAGFSAGDHVAAPTDYVLASGIFNVPAGTGEAAWAAHVEATVRGLWDSARRGIAFNCLSTHVDWRAEHLHYADGAEWLARAQRELSPSAALLHDYGLFEWTLVIRRTSTTA